MFFPSLFSLKRLPYTCLCFPWDTIFFFFFFVNMTYILSLCVVLGLEPKFCTHEARILHLGYIILSCKEEFFKPSVSHLCTRGNQSIFKNINGIRIQKSMKYCCWKFSGSLSDLACTHRATILSFRL